MHLANDSRPFRAVAARRPRRRGFVLAAVVMLGALWALAETAAGPGHSRGRDHIDLAGVAIPQHAESCADRPAAAVAKCLAAEPERVPDR